MNIQNFHFKINHPKYLLSKHKKKQRNTVKFNFIFGKGLSAPHLICQMATSVGVIYYQTVARNLKFLDVEEKFC